MCDTFKTRISSTIDDEYDDEVNTFFEGKNATLNTGAVALMAPKEGATLGAVREAFAHSMAHEIAHSFGARVRVKKI